MDDLGKDTKIKNLENKLEEAFNNQRFPEAIELQKELLNINPENLEYELILGYCLSNNNQKEEAIPLFKKYLEINPTDKKVITKLKTAYEYTNKWEECANFLEQVSQKLPKDTEILKFLINSYTALNDPKIISIFEKLIDLNPTEQYYKCALGIFNNEYGDEKAAINAYQKAYSFDPEDGHINELLGQYYASKGKFDDAFKHTIKSLTCKKHSFLDYYNQIEGANYFTIKGKKIDNIKIRKKCNERLHEVPKNNITIDAEQEKYIRIKLSLGIINNLFRETKVFNETFDRVEKAYKLAGNYTNAGIVAIHLMYYVGESISAEKVKERIVNLLLKDPSIENPEKDTSIFKWFKKKSKNPVQITNPIIKDSLLGTEYIIKVNDSNKNFSKECNRLENEYITQLFLNTHISEYEREFRSQTYENTGGIIRRPVLFFKNKNKAIFIQRKTATESLEENIIKGNPKQISQEIINALFSLATIHTISTSALKKGGNDYYFETADSTNNAYISIIPELIYAENLEKRFISRIGDNNKLKKFEEKYKKYINNIKTKFFLHGDYYPTNILSEGQIIDLEKRCMGSPTLDIAHLLEHPRIGSTREYLEVYAKSFEKINNNLGKDGQYIYDIINQEYEKNAVHVNLCLTGAMLAQENIQYAQLHLTKALWILENTNANELKESLTDYIRASPHESLKQIL